MTYPYIIIEQFSGEGRPTVHDFDNIKQAADYFFSSHRDDEIGFVREVNQAVRGEYYFLDRTQDFIAAWKRREKEELEEEWNELESGRENDHFKSRGTLEGYLAANAEGPAMKVRGIILEAAE